VAVIGGLQLIRQRAMIEIEYQFEMALQSHGNENVFWYCACLVRSVKPNVTIKFRVLIGVCGITWQKHDCGSYSCVYCNTHHCDSNLNGNLYQLNIGTDVV